jgi:diguanylate cyclase (GGDEF)-like protein
MSRARSETDLLRAVIDTQHVLATRSHDVDEVMRVIVERSRALTGADGAVVQLVEADEMVYRAAAGTAADALGLRLAVTSASSGRCVAEQVPMRCDDTEVDERVDRDLCRRIGARSMLVVPLLLPVSRECVGVLEVLSPDVASFDDDDLEVLDAMGDFIATAVRHAQDFAEQERQALRDRLTGLANERLLLDRLAIGLARSTRSRASVTVLFLDLDGFRAVNGQLGHDAGDQVLRSVGRALAAAVRPADTVARLRGDQFVLACEGVDEPHVADLVERVRWAAATAWPGPLPVTASVGLARSVPGDTAEALLARADRAMDAVKRARSAAR